jgi:hypothetical protein
VSSARFGGVVHGNNFGAALADVGDVPAESQAQATKLSDPLIALLSDLHVADPQAREERSILLGERIDLLERTEQFFLREREKARAALLEHHEDKKRQCREQQQAVEKLKTKIAELQSELTQARNQTALARAAATNAEEDRHRLSRYAAREEQDKADAAVQRAQAKVTELTEAEGPIFAEIHRLQFIDLPRASERQRQLDDEERDIALALNGGEGTNSLGFLKAARR